LLLVPLHRAADQVRVDPREKARTKLRAASGLASRNLLLAAKEL
jgi:hypothetical protein